MQGSSLDQYLPASGGRLATAWFPAVLSALPPSSGTLPMPVLGHAATVTNYVREFTHDGRRLPVVSYHQ